MALSKRVEVLFDPQQYQAIERIAYLQGLTVGALLRKAVEERYLRAARERRKAAIKQLLSIQSDLTWKEAKRILETDVGRRLAAR